VCLASAVLAMGVGVNAFSLHWTHSVEKIGWTEFWRVDGTELVLQEAWIEGSGAGMEPPDDAVFRQGHWVYRVPRRVAALSLAVSGATVSGWQWCANGQCQDLDTLFTVGQQRPDTITIRAGEICRPLRP
jgi:hypothetical protein